MAAQCRRSRLSQGKTTVVRGTQRGPSCSARARQEACDACRPAAATRRRSPRSIRIEASERITGRSFCLMGDGFSISHSLSMGGEPVVVLEHVQTGLNGRAAFSVSETGVLAFRRGSISASADSQLVVNDRAGREMTPVGPPANIRGVDLSRDGMRAAVHWENGDGAGDLWLLDLARNATSRLTPGGSSIRCSGSCCGRRAVDDSSELGRRTETPRLDEMMRLRSGRPHRVRSSRSRTPARCSASIRMSAFTSS